MSNVAEVLSKIENRFITSAATGLDVVFQFVIDDQAHHFVIHNESCQLVEGHHRDPNVTIVLDEETFGEMINREISPMQAFMSGRLRAEGEMMLATRLSDLFDI